MVTANRMHLAERAIRCFEQQTYPNKELVIIDDGTQDYTPLFDGLDTGQVIYKKVDPSLDYKLGKLRNISLDEATGDYLVQWDDDDWYHPERIEIQATTLSSGYDACCLAGALMHLNTQEFNSHPYIGHLPEGIPGSIMHRKDDSIRYPETRRAEDTVYLKEWMNKRYMKLDDSCNHLFLRAFHGDNTWEIEHFERRIKNSPIRMVQYLWFKYVTGDLFRHPKFRLTSDQQNAFDQYFTMSKELGLV